MVGLLMAEYTVDPAERLKVLLGEDEIGENDELTYSFQFGRETLYFHPEGGGAVHYSGMYHPGEGYCVGTSVCRYCGTVIGG